MSGRAPAGSDRGPGVARCPLLPSEAADWGDFDGFFGIRKSLIEVLVFTLLFDFLDALDGFNDDASAEALLEAPLPVPPL